MPAKVDLSSKFAQIHEHWQPRIAGELNGQLIKLVKFQGAFVWHHHDNEDEMFFVVKGQFRMEFCDGASGHEGPDSSRRDSARLEAVPSQSENMAGEGARPTQQQASRSISIHEGEFIIVPRGVEHRPVADEECWVMLFEPASTLNTGNVVNERTLRELKRV